MPYKRGNTWYLDYVDAAGVRHRVASKARTKAEAERREAEIITREERIRFGLEERELNPSGWTLEDMLSWFMRDILTTSRSHEKQKQVLKKHLGSSSLAKERLERVTPEAIERLLSSRKDLKLASQNRLRAYLSSIFTKAKRHGYWKGTNPCAQVERRRTPKPLVSFLSIDEARALLVATEPPWRWIFAVAVYSGLRFGEILGLKTSEVDLRTRRLFVQRSHGEATTKGGRGRVVPLHRELAPHLEEALRATTGPWLFPADGGPTRRPENTHGAIQLRRCLAHAGVTRHVRFHDLRHTTATLLLEAGADLHAVQRILGHSTIQLTVDTYGHLADAYLARQMERLTLDEAQVPEVLPPSPARPALPPAKGPLGPKETR